MELDASHPLTQTIAAATYERLDSVYVPTRGTSPSRVIGGRVTHRAPHSPSEGTVPTWIDDDAPGGEQIADLAQTSPLELRRQPRGGWEALDRLWQIGVSVWVA